MLNVDYLTDKIAPYSYIIRKADVLSLPSKRYKRRYFDLSKEQRHHYVVKRDEFLETLMNDDSEAAIYRTFTALQEITSGRLILTEAEAPIKHERFYKEIAENPRIKLLLETLEEEPQNKTIIWCKFQHEIDDISEVLVSKYGENEVQIFCGKTTIKNRERAIKEFREKSRFLIANKTCAGFGLNLQFCSQAIYYNNDWNWGTRAQSEDRVHRIGQETEVKLIDIFADKTIDRRILSCLDRKENLADKFRKSVKSKNAREWLDGIDCEDINDKNRI